MSNHLQGSVSLSIAVLDSKGNGHTHTEEECGKDCVGKTQHIFVHFGMFEPVGDVLQTGDVIHEEHEKHGECAEYINRGHSLRC
jgi:hypothetical protein